MKRMFLRFAVLMAAIVMTMTAQAKTQDWGGRVIDEKGEPMPFVNVVLLSLPDSAFVQGATTDVDGVQDCDGCQRGAVQGDQRGLPDLIYKCGAGLDYPDEGGHAVARRGRDKGPVAEDSREGRRHAHHRCWYDTGEGGNGE